MQRRAVLASLLLCAATASSQAVVPHAGPTIAADELTALPAAGLPAGKTLRTVRDVRVGTASAPAAWTRFAAAAGGRWSVAWDRATGVPTRIWGSGIAAPGAMASPAVAEQVARQWLAAHVGLLAPGAAATDFTLVSNTTDGDIRSVGFAQSAGGVAVLGGQIGFEFKRDRLFVIGSTALPNVSAPSVRVRLAPATLRARAIDAVRDQLALPNAAASALGGDIVVPLVTADGVIGYRLAAPITLDASASGRYLAYVDPASGQPIAVRQQNMFETGTIIYNGIDRYPSHGRADRVAPLAHVMVDDTAQTTDAAGQVTWSAARIQVVTTGVLGDLVTVVNQGTSGVLATARLSLAPGGHVRWDASATPEDDAQVNVFLSVNKVKDFVRTYVDPNMPTLDDPITANVNLDQDCNAYYNGAINFFHSSTTCQNTGLIEDVIFHEFGHALHTHEIIPGVGAFDGSMSEGVADFLAVNITNDHGLGRGFYYNDTALRDLDPVGSEAMWPRDVGEIHYTGKIFGGTWWDLRAAAQAALGVDAGEALILKLYVGALRRSVDIPSSLVEALATDDDDGDLSNGTPHECMIRTAYATHGMHTTTGTIQGPGVVDYGGAGSIQVRVDLEGRVDRCGADDLAGVTVKWGDGAHGIPTAGSVAATPATTGDLYYAQLPLPTDGPGSYRAAIQFVDGSVLTLPDNRADPEYQVYQAHTVKLYCTDFESGDPLADGWTSTAGRGEGPQWAWTVPDGGGTDPVAAYSGTHALVQTPGADYGASSSSSVTMPAIDVRPYSDVRLQYRRWLAVEDSQYDQATIEVNGQQVWKNATIGAGNEMPLQHVDKEWRFHDVPLSGFFTGNTVQVSWHLTSNGGLEFGGWALDDVCLVANPDSICGDGVRSITEQCDDGASNADAPDACRTDCNVPRCGDGIVDTGEQCDGGPVATALCSPSCKLIVTPATGGGGCSTSGEPGGVLILGGLLFGLRRRRARS